MISLLVLSNFIWITIFLIRKRRKRKLEKIKVEPITEEIKKLKRFSKFRLKLRRLGYKIYKYGLLPLNIFLIVGIVILYKDLSKSPYPINEYPDDDVLYDQNTGNVTVLFDRPVKAGDMKPYIFPEIKGEWKNEPVFSWLPMFNRKVTFYPQETFFDETKLFIYYAGIKNPIALKADGWEFGTNTFTVPSEKLVSIEPENNSLDVAVSDPIKLTFDKPIDKYTEWEIIFTPEMQYELVNENNVLNIKFLNNLAQTQEYQYKINRTLLRYDLEKNEIIERKEPEEILTGKFTTIKEPLVQSIAPTGEGLFSDSEIKIVFEEDMLPESASDLFKIEPSVAGEITWPDAKTLQYKHKGLAKETKYTIRLEKGLKSAKGGVIEKVIEHSFSTIGKLVVSGNTPGNGATNISLGTNFSVSFNQEADKASAQSKFSVSPAVEGVFSWNGNTMTFNSNADLSYNTTYTVTISPGIKSIKGVDSVQTKTFKFTTKPESFKLDLPVIYQKNSFSCNIDATRIALGYRGVSLSTESIYASIPKDPTPFSETNGERIWGNPNTGFVGDISGNPKGYGLYWSPISAFINKYRSSAVKTGWNRTALLIEVSNGNPVIVWAHNGYSSSPNGTVGTNISWKTPSGQSIYAIAGMHSFVVAGWKGDMENPTHVILHDTNRGVWTVSTSQFDSLWSVFNNSGVVVY